MVEGKNGNGTRAAEKRAMEKTDPENWATGKFGNKNDR